MEAAMGIALAAWETLQGGFTTIQSVGDPSEKPLRDVIRDHGFPGPRVLTSLAWVEGKGDSTGTPEQMRAIVRQRNADGADLIQNFRVHQPARWRDAHTDAGATRDLLQRSEGAGAPLNGACVSITGVCSSAGGMQSGGARHLRDGG